MREPQGGAVHASPTASSVTGLRIAPTMIVALVAAVFLAVGEAFGTGSMPFAERLLYWLLSVGGGTAIATVVAEAMARRGWFEGGLVRTVLLVSLTLTAPLTLLTWGLAAVMGRRDWRLDGLLSFAIPVFAVTVVLSTVNALIGMLRNREEALAALPPAPSTSSEPPPVRLLERLPRKLRGARILAVQAEDHYLRVHTDLGSDLILLRLSDAVAELDGLEGAQTHRSWWVARDAVDDVVRGDGRATLKLKGGIDAPVSRTFSPTLRQTGWF